ncbi:MAG: hypothetical protein A3F67_04350 [Verrucomicrobia bacterium RIFCSPHIGHO2_12_FULL_41_10]|nr:MAG: hypothetical protein A3F67_04350 [Verrucomicrobia bacterium RIFCSPHIGHO2_12_FULL_41_10]HLB33598.1 hypothetical protein [Chthoniobacterales bacterium]
MGNNIFSDKSFLLDGDDTPDEYMSMPSYARDDDSDYPFLFSNETYEEVMAQAEKYAKRREWRAQRELHKQKKREKRAMVTVQIPPLSEVSSQLQTETADPNNCLAVLQPTFKL